MPKNKPDWFVYSTQTGSTNYGEMIQNFVTDVHGKRAVGPGKLGRHVTIKGGANLMPKRGLITPRGVRTDVTDDEMSFLRTIRAFNRHIESGFLTVVKASGWADDADTIANDGMTAADGSAPRTPKWYVEHRLEPPLVGSELPEPKGKRRRRSDTSSAAFR